MLKLVVAINFHARKGERKGGVEKGKKRDDPGVQIDLNEITSRHILNMRKRQKD